MSSTDPSVLSRRSFVKQAGAAGLGAGLAAPAFLKAGTLGIDKEVRLAWIGVGGRGLSLLSDGVDNASSTSSKIVAICDIDPAARERGIKRCQDMRPAGIEDYRKVLEMKDVDGVVVATPIPLHKEMGVAAVQAGKHCYMEKPLGRTPQEVQEHYKAVKASSVRFQVGFQWRYHPVWQEMISKIHAGEIGKIRFITACRQVGGYPDSGWYVDRTLSGDLIVEQAVHEMNIFCWLMKGPPLKAAGFGGINALAGKPANRTIMDHYSLTYEFPDGVHLSYSHCVYMPSVPGSGVRQIVCGDHTAADLVNGIFYKGGAVAKTEMPEPPEPTAKALASFVDCIRNNTEPLSNVDAGRNATLMSILGRTAIYENRVARWEEVAL